MYIPTDSAYNLDPNQQDPYQLPDPYGQLPGGIQTAVARGRTGVAQPGATDVPASAAPDPGQWSNLQQQIFGSMPGIPKAPPFSFAAFQAPAPFSAPSQQDVMSMDPGYQFRVGEGSRALQQSAAARGVLNTGGTLQDLLKYGQGMGAQEYQQAYDRSLGTYQTNFSDAIQSWLANAGNAFNTYNTNYQTGLLNPYLQAMGQYSQGVQGQGQLFSQQFQTANA